jgi:hypothetical protein
MRLARSTAAELTDTDFAATPVSLRTRLAMRNERSKHRLRKPWAVPASTARRK